MKYNDMKKLFDDQILREVLEGGEIPDSKLKAWLLLLLFEIHGDLDSISVSLREGRGNMNQVAESLSTIATDFPKVLANVYTAVEECANAFTRVAQATEARMNGGKK